MSTWVWYCESQSPDVTPEQDHLTPHAKRLREWIANGGRVLPCFDDPAIFTEERVRQECADKPEMMAHFLKTIPDQFGGAVLILVGGRYLACPTCGEAGLDRFVRVLTRPRVHA